MISVDIAAAAVRANDRIIPVSFTTARYTTYRCVPDSLPTVKTNIYRNKYCCDSHRSGLIIKVSGKAMYQQYIIGYKRKASIIFSLQLSNHFLCHLQYATLLE